MGSELSGKNTFMNSVTKAILHTLVGIIPSIVALVIASHSPVLDLTIGQIISLIANFLISHSIPTTTGASARQ